ncbi:rhodanese-like domain-containing protein [Streptomyces sp. PTM05]|uniref:Rhodanese-like domain-containing protein n=1 Tax=Streptantibioticus parmotrematis TaxID=2873249 RepID=A0ABS7QXJ2_9ACTN|nr:rhodanese-like domain-containing protein [Streptantibioticus parmotrematis]MBY8887931.1 rhodanese-like domain-containing protein [Streptantibioticus parmotrematis]
MTRTARGAGDEEADGREADSSDDGCRDIDAQEADALIRAGRAVLLDVREEDEWRAGHAPGAVLSPLSGPCRAPELTAGQLLIAVCRSGRRSALVAERLRAAGTPVRNLRGGMGAWAGAGLPVRRPDGRPGIVA